MICYLDDDVDQDLLIRLAAARSQRLISPRSLGRSGGALSNLESANAPLADQLVALNHYR